MGILATPLRFTDHMQTEGERRHRTLYIHTTARAQSRASSPLSTSRLEDRHGRILRGGVGTPPLKNHKNVGLFSNTGPDSLKNHKTTKPAFNSGPLLARHLNGVSLAGRWWPAYSGGSAVVSSTWLETEGPRVRAPPASLRCGPWARRIYSSLVLVQPRKTRPCSTEILLMGRKESNQTNKAYSGICLDCLSPKKNVKAGPLWPKENLDPRMTEYII